MARPTKLTKELTDEICATVKAGNFIETAAAAAGISRSVLRLWLRKGNRAKNGIYREFLDRIKRAQAEAEIKDVKQIETAAEEQWQAAAWRLERRNYKRWGKKDKLQQEVIFNWREQVKQAGYEPDELFRNLVEAARERTQSTIGGSGAGVEGRTGRGETSADMEADSE